MPYGHASMLLLGEGAKQPSHTTNTIKFDCIPFDPCNSIKRFDLCSFDLFTATQWLPVTCLNTIWLNFFVESFGLKILSQVITKLGQLYSNSRKKYVNSRKYQCGAYAVYARSPSPSQRPAPTTIASRSSFPLGLCSCSTSLSKMGIKAAPRGRRAVEEMGTYPRGT